MADSRSLEILGIDELEEQVYRALLSSGHAAARDIAEALHIPSGEAQRLLDGIVAKGLATCAPGKARLYLAISPDVAIAALVSQRRADLDRACSLLVPELEELVFLNQGERHQGERIAEIIPKSVYPGVFVQMAQSLQSEVLSLQRAPAMIPRNTLNPIQARALSEGVQVRRIVDTEFLSQPGMMQVVQNDIHLGEKVRLVPKLPLRMVVFDRRIGLIPLDFSKPEGPALLLRRSALLEALCAYFETLWEHAAALTALSEDLPNNGAAAHDGQHGLVALLAAGLPDKVIAHELGISMATLSRRLSDLMKTLSARSRFQAGWIAAQSRRR